MAVSIKFGIVLEVKQIEENGFIVSFFTRRGMLRLFAQGLNKIESKNRANLIPGSIVEIEYFASRLKDKVGRLKKATITHFFDITNKKKNAAFLRIKKIFLNFNFPNHLFDSYKDYFDKFDIENSEKFVTFIYVQSTVYFGIVPVFNKCRICGSRKNLIDFQASEGGFICNKHGHIYIKTNLELNAYWSLFHNFEKYLQIADYNLDRKIRSEFYILIKESGHII
ncbi:DNA repair protein RecO [Mycoplasma sp. OR1901]|uniref:DNA repair protein RecO n=1 Tax=Mycoplasma sp. OR1901 TaxID=2742195 RepID=UPI00158172BF|nr:DNA repair protein RecO [Mycoplasma sp. OR1901]QKT05636.1 DNA repair protein RecO [Mycoplasma sp. OR1901]